jgi:hypothetical protein
VFTLLPKTKLGKWSIALIILMPAMMFVGSLLAKTLYSSVPAGDTFIADIAARPILVLMMLTGIASGISAFFLGISSIVKQKERALLVFLSSAIGAMLILLLIGELTFME